MTKLDVVVGMRMTRLEQAAVRVAAKSEGLPTSQYLRQLVASALTERATAPAKDGPGARYSDSGPAAT